MDMHVTTTITDDSVTVQVILKELHDLSEEIAKNLENDLENVVTDVLKSYFKP